MPVRLVGIKRQVFRVPVCLFTRIYGVSCQSSTLHICFKTPCQFVKVSSANVHSPAYQTWHASLVRSPSTLRPLQTDRSAVMLEYAVDSLSLLSDFITYGSILSTTLQ
ncbi:hypothetical protein K443DRAFT_353053 [Laccaria amethystina LaAM-08-1]|uniref:Uncharacterized protein n=1 Tax=Laccaria amethystina LaAM-08-1 TaxID=1095629 RepID=A0A0C9XUZ2_9AGAR|nr:hypothetical protein K443DRAFT_353053 [Laccaria amethystina LaAM-08-1]